MKLKYFPIIVLILLSILLSGCEFLFGYGYKSTWQEQAIADEDPNLCLKASHPDTCLQSYANEHKTLGACSLMKDENNKKACMTSFS